VNNHIQEEFVGLELAVELLNLLAAHFTESIDDSEVFFEPVQALDFRFIGRLPP